MALVVTLGSSRCSSVCLVGSSGRPLEAPYRPYLARTKGRCPNLTSVSRLDLPSRLHTRDGDSPRLPNGTLAGPHGPTVVAARWQTAPHRLLIASRSPRRRRRAVSFLQVRLCPPFHFLHNLASFLVPPGVAGSSVGPTGSLRDRCERELVVGCGFGFRVSATGVSRGRRHSPGVPGAGSAVGRLLVGPTVKLLLAPHTGLRTVTPKLQTYNQVPKINNLPNYTT